jgi:glycosyltransferase involved in cell wall biosynthesis
MKKILYFVSDLRLCGPNKQLFDILKNLDRKNFQPFVLTIFDSPLESFRERIQDLDIPQKSLFKSNRYTLEKLLNISIAKIVLEEFMQEIKPDLIHTQTIITDFLSSNVSYSIPKICSVRGIFPEHYNLDKGWLIGQFMTFLHINSMRNFNRVVAVSNSIKNNLVDNFSIKNVEVIENGVDTSLYFPAKNMQEKRELRINLKLPMLGNIWISCGYLSSRKNPIPLISVWKKKFNDDINNHLVFIGDGPLAELCRQISANSKNIHFVGHVKNVADYLRASDYCISASKAEGFPNSILESMASGLPLAISNIPPHKEILEIDNKVGRIFDISNEGEIEKAIHALLESDYFELSRACLNLVDNRLSSRRMSRSYQSIYSELTSHA